MKIPEDFNAASYFIDRHDTERPDKIAIECGGRRVTYRELFNGVNAVGSRLRGSGIRKGDRIILILPDTPEFAMSFFGAIKIGAIPVPLNPFLPPADYGYFFENSGARAVIAEEEFKNVLPSGAPDLDSGLIIMHAAEISRFQDGPGAAVLKAEPTKQDDPAFWLYSSGSTGRPKACVHRQRDMLVCSEHYAKGILNMTADDRCFSASKLFFAYGLGNALYYPFAVGATSILLPDRATPEKIFEVIGRYRPTLFFGVPTQYAGMIEGDGGQAAGDGMKNIRACVSAGEALPALLFNKFKERFGHEILDSIGSTEALQAFISSRPGRIRVGAVGELIPGYEAKILDEQGKEAADGAVGDLYVKNDAVCSEYWHEPEKTAATIRNGWLRTGDRFHKDADGYYWFVGRADDMFKSNGAWVSPVEVEQVIMRHPAVLESAVVGKKNAAGLMRPAAYVVLREDGFSKGLIEELGAWCAERLPMYKRPAWFEILPALPKTATGKIQRFRLRI
ncbi:MAG: benzoate-CoA ligase family protein [Patescibacteria group bacterium]|nr:benzoate-CoA ligase family protein [Patescibacteria group bacterium]